MQSDLFNYFDALFKLVLWSDDDGRVILYKRGVVDVLLSILTQE
ncbi:MAG: hypothetical protein EZS28_044341, partial [Streblomastix strix]